VESGGEISFRFSIASSQLVVIDFLKSKPNKSVCFSIVILNEVKDLCISSLMNDEVKNPHEFSC
jgi:hypothetical protein